MGTVGVAEEGCGRENIDQARLSPALAVRLGSSFPLSVLLAVVPKKWVLLKSQLH